MREDSAILNGLPTLVDKSIISVSFPDEEARYDVLDTVREYALECLAESGGLAAARKAHAETSPRWPRRPGRGYAGPSG